MSRSRPPEGVRTWPASQRAVRLVLVAAPVAALLVAGAAGAPAPLWLLLLTLLLGAVAAARPGSGAPTATMLVVLVWWGLAADPLHGTVLVAAALLAAVHVAALLADLAPPQTPLDGRLVRLWLGRGAGVLAAAPVLWVVARLLDGSAGPVGLWPAGLAAVLVAVVAVSAALPVPEPT